MRSISMAYPTIDLAATGAHIRQLRLDEPTHLMRDIWETAQTLARNLPSVDNLYALSKLWGVPMDKIIVEQAA